MRLKFLAEQRSEGPPFSVRDSCPDVGRRTAPLRNRHDSASPLGVLHLLEQSARPDKSHRRINAQDGAHADPNDGVGKPAQKLTRQQAKARGHQEREPESGAHLAEQQGRPQPARQSRQGPQPAHHERVQQRFVPDSGDHSLQGATKAGRVIGAPDRGFGRRHDGVHAELIG